MNADTGPSDNAAPDGAQTAGALLRA
ncbi:MAG: hypothetical protein RL227_2289, partial [Pseudomonadota bacterium]